MAGCEGFSAGRVWPEPARPPLGSPDGQLVLVPREPSDVNSELIDAGPLCIGVKVYSDVVEIAVL